MRLCYFSSLRESLGVGEEELELPEGVQTVGELTDWLKTRGGPWPQALSGVQLKIAVNHEIAGMDAVITCGDEIAWFPPVTGG